MPGIPENITIAGRTPATIKGNLPPLIDTAPAARGGFRAGDDTGGDNPVGVIFSENFDNQPDFTSAMHSTDIEQREREGYTVPTGWDSIRQVPVWAPSTGHPDRHEAIEILASNSDKARGGTGKSFVSWRDSRSFENNNYWNSESIMFKYFPQGYSQLYVEFWIRFDPNWTRVDAGNGTDISKLFRISSWRGDGSEFQAFNGGDLGPIALWDYSVNSYGVRNTISFRGGPHGDNYNFSNGDILGLPRSLINTGDLNMNFSLDTRGQGIDGADPQIPDRVNGGLIDLDSADPVTHNQIFGPGDAWTKIGIFVKMNSAPGVTDGIFRQWLNDEQILNAVQIPWIRQSDTEDESAKWNLVSLGGNDFFQSYPNEDRREEWYSIDDLVVRDSIPEGLL